MLRRRSLTLLTSLALGALASAQESRALFDAPLVELDSRNRIEHLVELDGTPGPEVLSWWWQNYQKDLFDVRCWDIDPQAGFSLLWEMTLDNPSGNGKVRIVPCALEIGGVKNDLITINGNTIRTHVGGRSGAPVLSQTLTAPVGGGDAFAADLDQDGDDDLITINSGGRVNLFSNDGTLSPGPEYRVVGPNPSRVRLAELTGDLTPDLFYVRNDAIVIQPIASDFTFPPEITFPITTPYFMPNPTVGDIDGDGDDDAVVFALDPIALTGLYTVLRRDGASSFLHESLRVGGPATDLVDLDGDGDLDGACCSGGGGISSPFKWHNQGGSTFELCHNDGTGNFTPAFHLRGLGAERLTAAADVDLDGDVDLVAGRVVYYAPAPITGPFETVLTSGEHQARLLRDWDSDGDPDLRPGYEEVRRSNGTGHFDPVTPEMKPPVVNGLAFKGPGYAGDFNGDGKDDLIVAKFKDGTFRRMRLLVNTGGGQLEDAGDCSDPAVSFSRTGEDYIDPRGGWAVDLEQDGDVDLFTWDPVGNSPMGRLWINDGSGYFQQSSMSVFFYPQGVGDFDGDQVRDLVLTDSSGRMSVGLGDGSGGFKAYKTVHPDAEIEGPLGAVGIGDFDDDGDLDLIGCDQDYYGDFEVFLFVNNGLASFTEIALGLEGPFYGQPDGMVLTTDANGDGWSDVIVSNLDSGRTSAAILLRNPDGVLFQPAFEQVMRPYQAKDLDGDDDRDLIDGSFDGDPLRDDRVVKNRRIEGVSSGWRRQEGDGVAGTGAFTPTLGARTFGGFAAGDSIKFLLTGAAPGVTGRLVINELGTQAASTYTVTPSSWGTLPTDGDVTKNFTRVIDFVTSGNAGDPPGTGKWDTRDVIKGFLEGRTFLYQVELDDPVAPNGLARTNDLYVRYAGQAN